MGLDRSRLKKTLKNLTADDSLAKKYIWKPSEENTKYKIRIVPNKFDPDFPFIERYFHYDKVDNRTVMSPKSSGDRDPFEEHASEIESQYKGERTEESKKAWRFAQSLRAKKRTYVPIVVRDKEGEGIKYWGFGKNVYTDLVKIFDNEEYDDISDVLTGTDLYIEAKKEKMNNGREYLKPNIVPSRKSTKLAESEEEIRRLHETQINFDEIYEIPTFDELEKSLKLYLQGIEDDADTDLDEEDIKSESKIDEASDNFEKILNEDKTIN